MSKPYNLRETRKPVVRLIETMDNIESNSEINHTELDMPRNEHSTEENETNSLTSQNQDPPALTEQNEELLNNLKSFILTQNQLNTYSLIETIKEEINKNLQDIRADLQNLRTECREQNQNFKSNIQNLEVQIENQKIEISDVRIEIVEAEFKTQAKINTLKSEINTTIENLKQELETCKQRTPQTYDTIQGNLGQNIHLINYAGHNDKIPQFNGKAINPIEFMNQAVEYINKITQNGLNTTDLKHIIGNMMNGSANQWWQMIKHDVYSIEQFKERFVNKYWNENIQSEIRRRLQTGRYSMEGRANRSEYFIEKVLILRNLTPKLTEQEIIKHLTNHFEKTIRDAIRVRGIKTIIEMEDLLSEEDIENRQDETPDHHKNNTYNQNHKYKDTDKNRNQEPRHFNRNMNHNNNQNNSYPRRDNHNYNRHQENQNRSRYNQREGERNTIQTTAEVNHHLN
jgi:hypothetical protein